MLFMSMPSDADIYCPSNCSIFSPLPYPFGAKEGCGSRGFRVTNCSTDTPVWNISLAGTYQIYYIKSIGANPNHSNPDAGTVPNYGYGGTAILGINPTGPPGDCESTSSALNNFSTSNLYAFEDADLTFYQDHYLFLDCLTVTNARPDSGVLTPSSVACGKYMSYCNFSSNNSVCLDYVPDKELPLVAFMSTYSCSSVRSYIIANVDEPVSSWVSAVQVAWAPVEHAESCTKCQKSGGECGYDVQALKSFQCYCLNGNHSVSCDERSDRTVKITIGVLVPVIFIIFCVGLAWYNRYKYLHHIPCYKNTLRIDGVNQGPLKLSYGAVAAATRSFSMKVGQGAFGKVYRGLLGDGVEVAVKVIDASISHADEQFLNEVATIGNIHHMNVARLMGFCFQRSKRILVYEYVSNGSLEKYIFPSKKYSVHVLSWKQRFDIALGIARGLSYMHEECRSCIIHCDIKPQNILLDATFSPKISDFGLARLLTREESLVLTQARGTPGYIAPEFWSLGSGPLTSKFDVYSYGVLLLEMIGGRRCYDMLDAVLQEDNDNNWISVSVDKNIEDEADAEQVKRCTLVAWWCIQDTPALRPTMSRVVNYLQGTAEVPGNPPKPFGKIYHGDSSTITQTSSFNAYSSATPEPFDFSVEMG
ncbi:hypothetical protein KP509_20G028000 [Ceratopteris richardii]|nr:hypothetical protein KP509_20G028000 [Ceratopteris richardii]